MAKKAWLRFLLPGVLILIVGVGLLVKFGMERAVAEEVLAQFPDRGVPRMNITLNGVTLSEINGGSKDTKYEGNELSLYEGSEVREFDRVRIKGRGNSTWDQIKKPYQIKFDEKVSLLGMNKAKKWYLLANYYDDTNLRDELAFNLERILKMNYPLNGRFVDVYFDGDYVGLYYLTEAVEIGKNRVDLRDELSILVELDNIHNSNKNKFVTGNGDILTIKDLKTNNENVNGMKSFLDKYNQLELAIGEGSFERIETLIDVESWAEFFLLSEIAVDPDAYSSSFYMWMDGIDDSIHAGPGWDYDYAFGNRKWQNWMGERFLSPTEKMIRKEELEKKDECLALWDDERCKLGDVVSSIMYDLMEFDEFEDAVARIFRERLAGKSEEVVSELEKSADKIREAARYNNGKWGLAAFDGEVQDLLNWIKERLEFLEGEYGGEVRQQGQK